MDKFQNKGLIIFVIVIFGTEVFVTIAWGVFLEEAGKVFQVFLLVSFELRLNVAMRRMEKKEMLIILLISIVLAVAISWMIQRHGGMSDQRWLHPGNFGL